MMDDLIELILEIILEGAIEAAVSKKVPLFIRLLLAGILFLFFGGLFGAILFSGIKNSSTLIICIALGLILMLVLLIIKKIKEIEH